MRMWVGMGKKDDEDASLWFVGRYEDQLASRDKRRRVEEAGRQYLKVKTLYIASARLKGPFTGL